MLRKLILTASLILFGSVASAAQLTVKDGYIKFEGDIVQGDAIRLVQLVKNTNIKTVHLNSPGGVAIEGFNLGYAARELELKLVIDDQSTCLSACGFMFLGGKEQVLEGLVGFHRPFIPAQYESQFNSNDAFTNGQGIGVGTTFYFHTMGYTLQLQALITQITNPETFLVFKNLDELNKFRFSGVMGFNNLLELPNSWVAERIAGKIRLHFLKPTVKVQNVEETKTE